MPERIIVVCVLVLLIGISSFAFAGEADVEFVSLDLKPDGSYYLSVTVRHSDTGWKHYANWWRVTTEDGKELGRRVLYHPHVDEQPFTRELDGLIIPDGPDGVKVIIVEAHDMVHEYGGKVVRMDITKAKGEGYSIKKLRQIN